MLEMLEDGFAFSIQATSAPIGFGRVFAPKWWQPWRWLGWWWTAAEDKGVITLLNSKIRYLRVRDR